MNCKTCGTWLAAGAMFCGECGSSVLAASALSDTQRFERNPDLRNSSGPAFGSSPEVSSPPLSGAQSQQSRPGGLWSTSATRQESSSPVVAPPATPEREPAAADHSRPVVSGPVVSGPAPVPTAIVAAASVPTAAVPTELLPEPSLPDRSSPDGSSPVHSQPELSVDQHDSMSPIPATTSVARPPTAAVAPVVRPGRVPEGSVTILEFSTGERVEVDGSGLVGRNPMARDGEGRRQIVRIVDPGLTVSKTHLEFGFDRGQFWISDRQSGNGTVIETAAGSLEATPGVRYGVLSGSRVYLGKQYFDVR